MRACRSSPCTSARASAPATTACAGASYDPAFIFAWPNNRIAVMGPEQAAGVLAIVTEEKLKRDGKPVDAGKLDAMKAAVAGRIEKESTALFATARLWDDGLIDPRDSRRVLGLLPVDLPRGAGAAAEAQHVRRGEDVAFRCAAIKTDRTQFRGSLASVAITGGGEQQATAGDGLWSYIATAAEHDFSGYAPIGMLTAASRLQAMDSGNAGHAVSDDRCWWSAHARRT